MKIECSNILTVVKVIWVGIGRRISVNVLLFCSIGPGPAVDVAELLERAVEVVDEAEPLLRLPRKVGGVRVQLLRLRVQPLLQRGVGTDSFSYCYGNQGI